MENSRSKKIKDGGKDKGKWEEVRRRIEVNHGLLTNYTASSALNLGGECIVTRHQKL